MSFKGSYTEGLVPSLWPCGRNGAQWETVKSVSTPLKEGVGTTDSSQSLLLRVEHLPQLHIFMMIYCLDTGPNTTESAGQDLK